jgi:hypothetical protein
MIIFLAPSRMTETWRVEGGHRAPRRGLGRGATPQEEDNFVEKAYINI